MIFKGTTFRFGNDVDTDAIIPARYLNMSDPEHLGKHCMEDADPAFATNVKKGDIIVAGKNFGCGSSREQAPLVIKHAGISAVIAKSFARIFFRNGINVGLVLIEADTDGIDTGDTIEVDVEKGELKNLTKKSVVKSTVLPDFMLEIIKAGGVVNYIKENKGFRL